MEKALKMESHVVLNVFPEELWDMIFENLNPKVLETSSNASPALRHLLRFQRNEFLFPTVLLLLVESERDQKLYVKMLLKCRSVCRSWREAVDKFLEFKPIVSHPSGYEIRYPMAHERVTRFKQQAAFLNHFESTHDPIEGGSRSPFIGTSLAVDPLYIRNFNIIVRNQEPIFPVYGQHVRHVKFTQDVNQQANYQILTHLPNLASLYIANNEIRHLVLENDVARLEEWQDFPVFHKLTYFKAVGVSPYLLHALLSKAPNLINLLVSTIATATTQDGILVPVVPMPHLEHWTLDTRMITQGRTTDIRVPFRTLSAHVGLQITSLDLFLPHSIVTADWMHRLWRAHPLNLPCLKKLKLHIPHWPCLDFVLGFKDTLEEIYARVWGERSPPEQLVKHCTPTKGEESIRYLDRFQNMEESNVWQLLPKLKKFSIDQSVFGLPGSGIAKWRWTRGRDPDSNLFTSNIEMSDFDKYRNDNLI